MKVAVTGATGLIGRHLIPALAGRGDAIVALTRSGASVPGAATVRWDPATEPLPRAARDGVDAIVNLAGAGIGDKRWSNRRREEIRGSRITVTRRCVTALGEEGPRVLISGSAMGYYGSGDEPVDETAPPGDDFLASVCVQWEAEAMAGASHGARVVTLRTAHVLAGDGGLLSRMLLPARLGLGGPLGNGRQWLSWIHADDQVGLILHALDHELRGPLNASAPEQVRQADFARALGRVLHRPAVLPTPRLALRVIAGEVAEIAVTGQRVVPARALETGYAFRFPTLDGALAAVLG